MKKNKEKESEINAEKTEESKVENTEEIKNDLNDEIEDEESEKKSEKKSKKDKKKEFDYKQKYEEINDKYLRLYSEFDNFRKRTNKEKLELRKMASAEIITALLPVVDDFERANQSMEGAQDIDAVKEGILLVFNKLKTIFNQQGVEEMKTIGEKFDPDLHEAITNIPAESEDKKGTIIDETQKGYIMNEKVIRYPKVVVAN